MNREKLFNLLKDYITKFEDAIKENYIDLSGISLDHICYKCSSKEEFESLRAELESTEKFIYQSIISKRRITIVGFKDFFTSICGELKYLELSDQKPDGSQKSSVDHIEPIPNGITYEEMIGKFSVNGLTPIEGSTPHHKTFDLVFQNGVKLKLSERLLIDKIYKEEMK